MLLSMRVELLFALHGNFAHNTRVALDNLAVRQFVFCEDGGRREDLITNVTLLVARGNMRLHVLFQFRFCFECL